MITKQFKLSTMDTFCYMAGDESTKTCALIDPAFDTKRILAEVKNKGYIVTHVINTHGHSDHSAGNSVVMEATNAKLLIHRQDAAMLGKFLNRTFSRVLGGKGSLKPNVLLEDEDEIKIGNEVLKVLHTPGHTRGGICLYTEGHIFTGDTLFVGAVGRTDLPGGSLKTLIQSIHEKIYTLPPETVVWPGHDYGVTPCSTVSMEKKTNPFTKF